MAGASKCSTCTSMAMSCLNGQFLSGCGGVSAGVCANCPAGSYSNSSGKCQLNVFFPTPLAGFGANRLPDSCALLESRKIYTDGWFWMSSHHASHRSQPDQGALHGPPHTSSLLSPPMRHAITQLAEHRLQQILSCFLERGLKIYCSGHLRWTFSSVDSLIKEP